MIPTTNAGLFNPVFEQGEETQHNNPSGSTPGDRVAGLAIAVLEYPGS